MSFEWKDKIDNEDYVLSEDINAIAHAVINLEKRFENIEIPETDLSNYYTKNEVDKYIDDVESSLKDKASTKYVDTEIANIEETVGDIETAVDRIIAIQEALIGGGV